MDLHSKLLIDNNNISELLLLTYNEAIEFLKTLNERPTNNNLSSIETFELSENGLGAKQTLELFTKHYSAFITGSAGPRYLGFVTGGTTPAAIIGDWLTSVYDQNASDKSSKVAANIELSAFEMLRDLFGLPKIFNGNFVSGATMSNFVGLAIARQWWGKQHNVKVSETGLTNLSKRLYVLSASPHSSIYKCLSMLGIGRESVQLIPTLPQREAIDVTALEKKLQEIQEPCIVVANAGVVNTVDFDDIKAISRLKEKYVFYLHIDAAFGGFAACSPKYKHLLSGWEEADSIAVDAHKWLNVPYDSAIELTKHLDLQVEVFQNSAAYLTEPNYLDAFHRTPENSRRLRALPALFTLMAYGKIGYQEIVERTCDCAIFLGEKIANSSFFTLLAPVKMNVVVFTFNQTNITSDQITYFLTCLCQNGKTFLTPTNYRNRPAMRAAFSNWRTTQNDVEIIWQAILEARESITL
ncbi:MAG: aspartate aminotransferase family protein [Acidobacteria bacterium]|nr:aspartate aminotransferase family protein [Acidobacteriota bacterium]